MTRCVIYLQGPSILLNPTLDRGLIEAAYADDPEAARSEYGGQFRSDVSAYLSDEVIGGALCPGERSRPYLPEVRYAGFVDAAGGGGTDSMTAAVAHQGERGRVLVDQLIAIDPPFDTESAVERCALALKSFGVTHAQADRYGGLWPAQAFARHGINLVVCELNRSQLYAEIAPLFVSRLVSLVDDARLEVELRGLERTPKAGGRPDVIDHAPGRGSHDDRINAVAGALWLASRLPPSTLETGSYITHTTGGDYDPLALDDRRRDTPAPDDPRPAWARPTLILE